MIVQDLKSRNVFLGVQGKVYNTQLKAYPPESSVLDPGLTPLSGVQRVRFSWEHEIGNTQGLSANFLQSWYNKPVRIIIEGESYMGMFGGQSLAAALQTQQREQNKLAQGLTAIYNKAKKEVNNVAKKLGDIKIPDFTKKFREAAKNRFKQALPGGGSVSFFGVDVGKTLSTWGKKIGNTAEDISDWGKETYNKSGLDELATKAAQTASTYLQKIQVKTNRGIGPYEDGTVQVLKDLISFFNYGPSRTASVNENLRELEHVMILENEKGLGDKDTDFAVFVGYVIDLEYDEDVEDPFIYKYSFTFVGIPQTLSAINAAKVSAAGDVSRPGVTFTITDGIALLRQGLGL